MRYLLDTGVFLWSLGSVEKLNQAAQELLVRNHDELYLSAVSSWEISIKNSAGKLELPEPPQRYVPQRMRLLGLRSLPITHSHALAVSELPQHHNDPFDRLLIAQALSEGLTLMTAEAICRKYPVEILWAGR
ncbi:MAG TPA: type II toxin-antitoxin system VapC family toxin [Candidatus Angelobacter sp.]|nr:type II toxin-antitoxin system VapC family toxin [Candidatus Angelobacter sp.]